jgi:hypothetical protein
LPPSVDTNALPIAFFAARCAVFVSDCPTNAIALLSTLAALRVYFRFCGVKEFGSSEWFADVNVIFHVLKTA